MSKKEEARKKYAEFISTTGELRVRQYDLLKKLRQEMIELITIMDDVTFEDAHKPLIRVLMSKMRKHGYDPSQADPTRPYLPEMDNEC